MMQQNVGIAVAELDAIMRELMLACARQIGMAGVVVYGAISDYGWIGKHDFPVFATGVTHRGPYKDGPRPHQAWGSRLCGQGARRG
jgi:regulator of RNase E activity RraA